VPFEHALVFLDGVEVDVPKSLDLVLDLVHARVACAHRDLMLERRRVFIREVIFVPDVILHGAEFHLEPALGHLLLVNALRKIAGAREQFFAPRALLIERS